MATDSDLQVGRAVKPPPQWGLRSQRLRGAKGAQRQTKFTETEAGHYTYGAKLSNVWLQAGWGPASYLV